MIEFVGMLILGLLAAGLGAFMLFSNVLFGPKRPNPAKDQPFECGVEPISVPSGQLPVHFYVLAMLFVVFDVEIMFLFPWAVLVRELGWFGILEMGFFLTIILGGFIYAWRQGAREFHPVPRRPRTTSAGKDKPRVTRRKIVSRFRRFVGLGGGCKRQRVQCHYDDRHRPPDEALGHTAESHDSLRLMER